jgi:hypothetical protein
MKENLNKNIITVLILEISTLVIAITFNFIDSPFMILWEIFALTANFLAVFLLFKHKPKFYILTSAIALSIILIPVLFIFYLLSKIQC